MTFLQVKVLAMTESDEVGRLFLNTLLLENGLSEIKQHFAVIMEKRIFSQVILAVFFGQADAGIVTDFSFDTIAELNPQIRNRLKIIAASPPVVHAVSILRKDIDDETKKTVMDLISRLDESAEGQQVLTLFKIDRMVPIYESDLSSMVELYSRYARLKSDASKTGTYIDK